MATFITNMTKDEMIACFQEDIKLENATRDMAEFYNNLAGMFLQLNNNETVTPKTMLWFYGSLLIIEFVPRFQNIVPNFLPQFARNFCLNFMLKRIDRFSFLIQDEDVEYFVCFYNLFSRIVNLVCDERAFVQEVVAYTEQMIDDNYDEAIL
jgi:hypothetical protein